MTIYRRVKASTLIKRHLPYCGNCQEKKETKTTYPIRPDGYQPKSYSLSSECLCNENGTLDQYWYHSGAGCPNFKEKAEGV